MSTKQQHAPAGGQATLTLPAGGSGIQIYHPPHMGENSANATPLEVGETSMRGEQVEGGGLMETASDNNLEEMSPRQELAMMHHQVKKLQEQLVDLYLSVKIRSNEEVRRLMMMTV